MKKSIVATKSKSCSYTRWLRKKVYEKKILYNGKTLNGLIQNGKDKFDYSMTIENGALCLAYDADISKLSPRPFFSVKIPFEPGDYSNYNRVRVKVFVAAEGFQNMYWHFCLQGDEKGGMHAPSTPVNEWYDCVWEINHLDRSNLSFITVMPFVGGCPPEALKDVKVYIKSIALEKVDPDYELGYQLEDRIAYSHLGYYPNAKKEFIVQKGEAFKILKNKKVVYSANLKEVETTLGKFKVGNFSHITERGTYQIECDGLSEEFVISDSPYTKGIQGSLDFLYQLRCGEDIPLVHSACHLNAKAISNGKTVPVFGGWHDAGDLSQFEICTAEMTRALLDLSFTNKKLNKRILEEAKVGLNWLLRTTFKDGTRALAISYRHWYDNIVTAEDKYPLNSGENGPFENFIAADALAYGYLAFKDTDKVFANWCLRTAIDDFKFGVLGYAEGKYTNPMWHFDVTGEFNFFRFGIDPYNIHMRAITPFIFLGIGFSAHNVYANDTLSYPVLETKVGSRIDYAMYIPIGVGLKWKFAERWQLQLAWQHNIYVMNGDGIEGVVDRARPNILNNSYELNGSNVMNNDVTSTLTVGIVFEFAPDQKGCPFCNY